MTELKPKSNFVKCPSCDGLGTQSPYDDDIDCDDCDGTGCVAECHTMQEALDLDQQKLYDLGYEVNPQIIEDNLHSQLKASQAREAVLKAELKNANGMVDSLKQSSGKTSAGYAMLAGKLARVKGEFDAMELGYISQDRFVTGVAVVLSDEPKPLAVVDGEKTRFDDNGRREAIEVDACMDDWPDEFTMIVLAKGGE